MNGTVQITLGGETIDLPALNLDRLERVVEHMDALTAAVTLAQRGRALAPVLAAGLSDITPGITAEQIGTAMWASEIEGLYRAVGEFFTESGLVHQGEAAPEAASSTDSASAPS